MSLLFCYVDTTEALLDAEPTLALKHREGVTRNPKRGTSDPKLGHAECVRLKKPSLDVFFDSKARMGYIIFIMDANKMHTSIVQCRSPFCFVLFCFHIYTQRNFMIY